MGKIFQDQQQSNCPICYNHCSSWVQPKRCKHKYCQQCLAHWVKKGKKSCPLCRKSFNSVLKYKKKRDIVPNKDTDNIELIQQLDINQIKKSQSTSNNISPMYNLGFSYVVQRNYQIFTPWPMTLSVFDVYQMQ